MLRGGRSQRSVSASRRSLHSDESGQLPPCARSSKANVGTFNTLWVFSWSGNAWVDGVITDVIDDTYIRVEYTVGEHLCGKTMRWHSEDLFIHAGAGFSASGEADPECLGSAMSRSRSRSVVYDARPGELIIFDGLPRGQDLNGHHGVVLNTSTEQGSSGRVGVMILTAKGATTRIVTEPSNLKRSKRAKNLKEFFSREYLLGLDLTQSNEYRDLGLNESARVPWYEHRRTGIRVWKHALDLRSTDGGDFSVVFHYTNELAAHNITAMEKPTAELWASLRDRSKADTAQQDTGFGEGVYVSKLEPGEWKSKEQILINNFCHVAKFDGRADRCIPLLVPTSFLTACVYMEFGRHKGWHIQEHFYDHVFTDKVCSTCRTRRDDDLREALQRHEIDIFERDVWIVKRIESKAVQHARTNFINVYKNMFEIRKEVFGDRHPTTLFSYADFGTCLDSQGKSREAEPVLRKAVEGLEEVMGKKHPITLQSYADFGQCLASQGKTWEAERVLREVVESLEEVMGKKHPATLQSYANFGKCLVSKGKPSDAELVLRNAVEGLEEVMGKKHPSTLQSYADLGKCLNSQGKSRDAEPVLRKAADGLEEVMGERHPETLKSHAVFGQCLDSQGKSRQAEPVLRKAIEGLEMVMGERHPTTLQSYADFGMCLVSQGKSRDAEPVLRKAAFGREEVMGKKHPATLQSYADLGMCLVSQGNSRDAEFFLRKAVEGREEVMGEKHPATFQSYAHLGKCLDSHGRSRDAELVLRKAVEGLEEVMGERHLETLKAYADFGMCLKSQGKSRQAEPVLRKAVEGLEEVMGEKHPVTLQSYADFGMCLVSQGKALDAELVLRKAFNGREEVMGKKHPATLQSYADFGKCLDSQGKSREAELVLLEAVESFNEVLGKHHPSAIACYFDLTKCLELRKSQEAELVLNKAVAG